MNIETSVHHCSTSDRQKHKLSLHSTDTQDDRRLLQKYSSDWPFKLHTDGTRVGVSSPHGNTGIMSHLHMPFHCAANNECFNHQTLRIPSKEMDYYVHVLNLYYGVTNYFHASLRK